MRNKFSELLDVSKLKNILEGLYFISGISSGIIDIDGNCLVSAYMQDICLKFHRAGCQAKFLCRQSDMCLANYIREGFDNIEPEPYIWYTCPNGLINIAAPVIINGEYLATILLGQLLFEKPDIDKFRKQANKYGFDEEEYIAALKKVPIYTKEKVESFIHLFLQLANLVALMGVTQLRLIESQRKVLRESESLLSKSQKVARIGSFVMDLKTKIWRGSPELYNIAGIDKTYPHTAKGWNKIIHPDYRRKISDYFFNVEAEQLSYDCIYKIIRVNDGEQRWVHGLGDFEFDDQGNPIRLIATVQDITKRRIAEEEVIYLSYHDKLTGLYNRRFYEEEVKRLDTERNFPISIIIGDVNGLKLVNDAFGHAKGDELLQKAAVAIQSACRADDIVARWGGDEFVILLPKTKSEEAERIINRIKQQYANQQVNALSISISFGWATKNKIDEDIQKVLKRAEDHMYKHKTVENESVRSNIISTIIKTLHEKNSREEQHSERVSEICQSIGKAMGFSEIEVSKLKVVGLLHDIGKIAIEEGILNKPGKLTEQEYNEIKRHPEIGYRILTTSYDMLELANYVLAHHERWDGTGYPKGIKGEAIPRIARIIALADSYDAMTSERPYRNSLSVEEAIKEIIKNSGIQFDPEIVRIFLEDVLCIEKEYFFNFTEYGNLIEKRNL
jgi:diguanylate cyclase (GGDEF)-like protein/PAS domain S-box-containing protein